MKPLKFMGGSLADLANFPEAAKKVAGFELWQVQVGAMPSYFKPMPTVGVGAYEVRIKVQGQWRQAYGRGVCAALLSQDHAQNGQGGH